MGNFGESLTHVDALPKQFTLYGSVGRPIARMQLESVWTGYATHRSIPVDNLVLVQVPEPATMNLLAACALCMLRPRNRKA